VGGGSANKKAVVSSKTQESPAVKKNTPTGAEALAEVTEQTNPVGPEKGTLRHHRQKLPPGSRGGQRTKEVE
jgi:hypothetical protein